MERRRKTMARGKKVVAETECCNEEIIVEANYQSDISERDPALTPEGREMQLISLAVNLAEKQLMEGTASAQVITHYLKLGSTKERLEREKLEEENKLLRAKTNAIQSSEEIKVLYEEAIRAMQRYSGANDQDEFY
jgi:hypothetical protein